MDEVDRKAAYDWICEGAPSLLVRAHMMLLAGHSPAWIVERLRSQMIEADMRTNDYGLSLFQSAVDYLAAHRHEIGIDNLPRHEGDSRN